MYIYEIVIDGFKSYAHRTVVGPFDPHFNAITGLNGSGKSNILDSICFVLGITTWGQLRASSLQDLIYKQGTAGIERASVSIVFNNEDETKSPTGYENEKQITVTRQIVLGGRNKFLINGRTAQLGAVQNLFQSVQLNISNPHFLIMQGHIAKVLNMKPMETLSMLEEASGTRMFESKKATALKTIEQKDTKVEDINKILTETIMPKLEKLRKERTAYKEYLSLKTKLESDTMLCAAYEFALCKLELKTVEDGELAFRITEIGDQIKEKEASITTIESQITQLKKGGILSPNSDISKSIDSLEKEISNIEKEIASLEAKQKSMNSEIDSENKSLKKLKKAFTEMENAMKEKEIELKSAIQNLETCTSAKAAAESTLHTLQHGFSTSAGGKSEDESNTLEGQVMKAKASKTQKETQLQLLLQDLESSRRDLETAQNKLKKSKSGGEYQKMEEERKKLKTRLEQLSGSLNESIAPSALEASLLAQHPSVVDQLAKAKEFKQKETASSSSSSSKGSQKKSAAKKAGAAKGKKAAAVVSIDEDPVDLEASQQAVSSNSSTEFRVEQRLIEMGVYVELLKKLIWKEEEAGMNDSQQLEFTHFKVPTGSNVDTRKIKGQVCRLVDLKEESTALALTIAGGNRWHNVVIENESVAKQLLKEGKLQKRITFIPLDTMSSKPADVSMATQAQQMLGASNVAHSQSLVKVVDSSVAPAISHVLGDTLICQDASIARKATFDLKLARSVTLDGDVFDKKKTLTGGADPNGRAPVLTVLHKEKERESKTSKWKQNLQTLTALVESVSTALDEYQSCIRQLQSLESRLSLHSFHEATSDIERLEKHIEALSKTSIPQAQHTLKETEELIQSLEAQLKSQNDGKGKEKERLASEKQKQSKILKDAQQTLRNASHIKVQLESELQEMVNEFEEAQKEITAKETNLKTLTTRLEQIATVDMQSLTTMRLQKKAKYDEEHRVLEAEKGKLKVLGEKRDTLKDALSSLKIDHNKSTTAWNEAKAKSKKAKAQMAELIKKFPGIEKDNFALGIQNQRRHLSGEEAENAENVDEGQEHGDSSRMDIDGENRPASKSKKSSKGQSSTFRRDDEYYNSETFFTSEIARLSQSLANSRKQMAALERSINTKASAMLDSSEREYDDLTKKKKLIENDKATILKTIQDLEGKKLETLKRTFEQVSNDFKSIFSTLLPGASAKLLPVESAKDITSGLVVKVDLNNNFSTSLSELSGGQRSLLALSLVLALLRYNPAPMYILDEIDAALDLSHTQNIGTMLKTHFSQSQFIIVSLKEGMFNNANVLFKTRFELGISRVDRYKSSASTTAASSSSALAVATSSAASTSEPKNSTLSKSMDVDTGESRALEEEVVPSSKPKRKR